MQQSSPRLWPNSPSNSPLPLPTYPTLYTLNECFVLKSPPLADMDSMKLPALREWIGGHTLPDGSKINDTINLDQCVPMLLIGELSNPCRLNDIGIEKLPIVPVRIEHLARTWADGLDAREVQPGVHHVTLASSPGWWELTHLTLAPLSDLKTMTSWLNNGRQGTWKPVKLAEGNVRIIEEYTIIPPAVSSMNWDGECETVNETMPKIKGPELELADIFVPIHTNYGCYDSRGKIIRCAHVGQRKFHQDFFRKGSSKKWDNVLKIR